MLVKEKLVPLPDFEYASKVSFTTPRKQFFHLLLIFEGRETEETHWPNLLTEKGNGFRKQITWTLYLNREVNMHSTNFDAMIVSLHKNSYLHFKVYH